MTVSHPPPVARQASAAGSDLLAVVSATALCLACGFCCNGTLHTNTVLLPEEVDAAAAAGLLVEIVREAQPKRGAAQTRPAFRQPCAMFNAGRCSIYEDRPLVCRRYECALLKRLLARETALEQALRVVGTVHQQLAVWRSPDVRGRAPSAASFMHWLKAIEADEKAEQGDARSADAILADPDASNHAVALILYLTKYFGEAGEAASF